MQPKSETKLQPLMLPGVVDIAWCCSLIFNRLQVIS